MSGSVLAVDLTHGGSHVSVSEARKRVAIALRMPIDCAHLVRLVDPASQQVLVDGAQVASEVCVVVLRADPQVEKAAEDKLLRVCKEFTMDALVESTVLNLYNKRLKTLPESLAKFTALQELDVSRNGLGFLPEGLDQLRSLQVLNVSCNNLDAWPETLETLSSLKVLYIYSNQLSSLPESLGALRSLQELDVSSNRLRSVPESLGHLTRLHVLDVSNNRLSSLPETLGVLSRLESLYIYNNPISCLPESFCALGKAVVQVERQR